MIATVATWAMFYATALTFGFDEVTEAVGSGMDRIGLTVSEARE